MSEAVAGLTVMELRTAIQQRLRHTGALRQLKTELRGMVLTDILQHRRMAAQSSPADPRASPAMTLEQFEACRDKFSGTAGGGGAHSAPVDSALTSTWAGRVADCLIHNHLLRTSRVMSLSIFATEAEVPPLSDTGAPSDEELFLCQLLGLPGGSEEEGPATRLRSALQLLVEEGLRRRGEEGNASCHRHQCGTQTDDLNPPSDSTSPLTSMECRLAAVDAKYALTFSQLKQGGGAVTWRGEVERRMNQYKEDLNTLLRDEYQQRYKTFEQGALHEARERLEDHYKTLQANHAQEMQEKERTLRVREEQERDRTHHTRHSLEEQRQRLEKKQLELISFQQEMESEVSQLQVKLKEQRDTIQALRFQCEKWEELCTTRLLEAEAARGREMRRTEELHRAKVDYAAELHVMDEEIHQLHFRLRTLTRGGRLGGSTQALAGDEDGDEDSGQAGRKGLPGSWLQQQSNQYDYDAAAAAAASRVSQLGVDAAGIKAADSYLSDVKTFIRRTDRSQYEEATRQNVGAVRQMGNSAAERSQVSVASRSSATGAAAAPTGAAPSADSSQILAETAGSSSLLRPASSSGGGMKESTSNPPLVPIVKSSSSLLQQEQPTSPGSVSSYTQLSTPNAAFRGAAGSSNAGIGAPGAAPGSIQSTPVGTATHVSAPLVRSVADSTPLPMGTGVSPDTTAAHPDASTISNQPPQTQRSTNGSSLLAMAAKVLKPEASNSSTSSTTSSSSPTSPSSSKGGTAAAPAAETEPSEAELQAKREAFMAKSSRLASEEASARIPIDTEEETARKAVQWSFRSRLTALQAAMQKASSSSPSSTPSDRSSGSRENGWLNRKPAAAAAKVPDTVLAFTDSDADSAALYDDSTRSSF